MDQWTWFYARLSGGIWFSALSVINNVFLCVDASDRVVTFRSNLMALSILFLGLISLAILFGLWMARLAGLSGSIPAFQMLYIASSATSALRATVFTILKPMWPILWLKSINKARLIAHGVWHLMELYPFRNMRDRSNRLLPKEIWKTVWM